MSECRIVFTLNSNDDSIKLLNYIRALAAKGYRRFTIYVTSRKGKPHYLEDLRPLIQSNISYGLKFYYAGSSKTGFEKPNGRSLGKTERP